MIVDDDVGRADDLEPIVLHDDGRVLVQADAEQLRFGLDDFDQVELTIAT